MLQALLSLFQSLFEHNTGTPRWLRQSRTDVVTFSLAMAAIMHCYSDTRGAHRDIFRSKYLNVLDFVFGVRGMQSGSISHASTNRDLLLQASEATRCVLSCSISESWPSRLRCRVFVVTHGALL